MRVNNRQMLGQLDARGLVAAAQVLLVLLLAFLAARLIWAVATPVGPVGAPPAPQDTAVTADASIFSRFDPFFQMLGPAGPAVVSDLDIELYGTRVDNVNGRGSAILAVGQDPQRSFLVGEQLMPG